MLRGRQVKPPVADRINWGNPITSRLCFCALFNEQGATQIQNLVGQTRAPFTGSTGPSWGTRQGLKFPGGANTVGYLNYGAETFCTDLGRNTSNPVTFLFRAYVDSSASAGIAARNDTNTLGTGWQIQAPSSNLLYAHESSTTNMLVLTALTPNLWHTVAIVSDGSLTATNQIVYIDGKIATHTFNQNGSGTPGSDAAQTLYIGRDNFNAGVGGPFSMNGSIDYFYIWKRMLSSDEVKLIGFNPYQFIGPATTLDFKTPSASVAGERTQFYMIIG